MKIGRFFFSKCIFFPGQGTQKVGMNQQFVQQKWSLNLLERFNQELSQDISKLMLEGPQDVLNQTENAQPAIFINSYLSYLQYEMENKMEDFEFLIGHSVGEYTALCVAQSLDPFQTVKLLKFRGQLMKQACQGIECGMLAIQFSPIHLEQFLQNFDKMSLTCEIALINSPNQVVVSGNAVILKELRDALKVQKIRSVFLQVSAAFHCSLLKDIRPSLENYLQNIEILIPKKKIISNYDLIIYKDKYDIIRGLVNQLDNPVLFQQSVAKSISLGVDQMIDIGSSKSISKLLKEINDFQSTNIKVISI